MSVHECLSVLWSAYQRYAIMGLVYGLLVFAVYYVWPAKDEDWPLGKALWMGVWVGIIWPPMIVLVHHLLG